MQRKCIPLQTKVAATPRGTEGKGRWEDRRRQGGGFYYNRIEWRKEALLEQDGKSGESSSARGKKERCEKVIRKDRFEISRQEAGGRSQEEGHVAGEGEQERCGQQRQRNTHLATAQVWPRFSAIIQRVAV